MSYFDAYDLIKAQLDIVVTTVPASNILTVSSLTDMKAYGHLVPAIQIIYNGHGVDESLGGGSKGSSKKQLEAQFWNIVIVTQKITDPQSTEGITASSLIIDDVIKALQGFELPHPYHQMKRTNPDFRPTLQDGFEYQSYQFTTRLTTHGGD